MQVGIDVKFMCIHFFVGVASLVSEILLLSKMPFDPWTIFDGHQNFNQSESVQKIHASRD